MASKQIGSSRAERKKLVVLVTGGSGLVGNSLRDVVVKGSELETEDYGFIFLSSNEANLIDANETRLIFEKYRPNCVIHLAAKVGGLYANMRDGPKDTFYDLNKRINENVLRTAFDSKVDKCISCLSTCIFPDEVDLPLDESKIHLGPPHNSNRGYSLAKREVDLLNKCLNRESDGKSKFVAIIPTNLYGKYDNFNLIDAHVIPGLIHKAYLSMMEAKAGRLKETCLIVMGSGNPLRQFVYAPDLARFLVWCLKYYLDEEPIIVCPDDTMGVYRIRDVAEMICKIFSRKFSIEMRPKFDTAHVDGQFCKTATNRKLRKLLPEFQFTNIEFGLEEVIDWFCEAYPNVRK